MRIQSSTVITLTLLALIIAGAAWYAWSVQSSVAIDTQSAADQALGDGDGYVLKNLDGSLLDVEQFAGSVRVVNSWASWCPFCVNELPDFNTVASEYTEHGVVVLAVNRAEPVARVQAFLRSIQPTESLVYAIDETDGFYDAIGGFTMPETVFYDRFGEVVVHKRGFMDKAEMRHHIEAALAVTE